jgi:hypothetical protein
MTTFSLDHMPSAVAPRARRRGWFARFIAAVQESRMRSAQAVIARHRGFMPVGRDVADIRPDAHGGDQPPRVRRD